MIENKKFPYSDYDVVVIDKEEILKTIDDNIIDKEIALDLISSLEVKAESHLRNKKWVSIPRLGNIRIPPGLSEEIQSNYREARQFAYSTMNKKNYIAFVKEIAQDNNLRIKYNTFFKQILSMAIKKDKRKFTNLSKSKGESYASCKMVFGYRILPMKEDYEYIIGDDEQYEQL